MCERKLFEAKLYQEVSNEFIKIHIKPILNTYGNLLLEWNKNGDKEEILDIGCGEGSTTIQILNEFVSKNTKNYNILGADFLASMITLAKEKFSNVQNIQFKQLDILDIKSWIPYKERFDKVFSILCLMFPPNPKIWVKNIYNILKPNGQIFFVLILNHLMVKHHISLCKQPKWEEIQVNNALCSEYFLNENRKEWIIQHLKEGGFKNVKCYEVFYDYPFKNINDALRFTNSFTMLYETIPEHLQKEYLNELCEGIEEERLMNSENSKICYLVIAGRK